MISKRTAFAALAAFAASAPAHAAVTISAAATQNMNCAGGTCTPTATKAVLNAGDLESYLSQFGNVRVMTTGSGVEANNIEVRAAFTSPDSTSLTLEAHKAITVDAAVSIGSGTSELELQSDTQDASHTLSFGKNGHITFGSLSDIFGINGGIFTLVGSVQGLASAVASNPSGAYALANDYDASQDGTYTTVPVATALNGLFEGLGNTIANLTIEDTTDIEVGLFASLGTAGALRDVRLVRARVVSIVSTGSIPVVGALVGYSDGFIFGSFATGSVTVSNPAYAAVAGGLVGFAYTNSNIVNCYATDEVKIKSSGVAGGLLGEGFGTIASSFAAGAVTARRKASLGGLIGSAGSPLSVSNTYATGAVTSVRSKQGYVAAGGLVGSSVADFATSYATGLVSVQTGRKAGGFIGDYLYGSIGSDYWDIDTSGMKKGIGDKHGTIVQGLEGLTTQQLQSGLPAGFDPKVWAENPNINNGLPYLINNPPPK